MANARTDYSTKFLSTSANLSVKEKLKLSDLKNALQLDEITSDNKTVIIKPVKHALMEVHNEHANDNKDYQKLVIVNEKDEKFVTGSKSFIDSFFDIVTTMEEANETDYEILIYRIESKNYKGKSFITCSIA